MGEKKKKKGRKEKKERKTRTRGKKARRKTEKQERRTFMQKINWEIAFFHGHGFNKRLAIINAWCDGSLLT